MRLSHKIVTSYPALINECASRSYTPSKYEETEIEVKDYYNSENSKTCTLTPTCNDAFGLYDANDNPVVIKGELSVTKNVYGRAVYRLNVKNALLGDSINAYTNNDLNDSNQIIERIEYGAGYIEIVFEEEENLSGTAVLEVTDAVMKSIDPDTDCKFDIIFNLAGLGVKNASPKIINLGAGF